MKKFVCLYLLIIIASFSIKAQGKFPPVFEIKADTGSYVLIPDTNWQMLEDASGKLTVNRVSSPAFDTKFHYNNTRTKGYDYNIKTYWARYAIKNTLTYPISITIPEGVAYAYLYMQQPNHSWKIDSTGRSMPWSKRTGLKRITEFVIAIAPGQTVTVYEKDVFDFTLYKPKFFSLSIGFKERVVQANYVENDRREIGIVLNALVLGILLMAGLTNLLFFRIVREKTYLYFSLFLIFYGGYTFLNGTDIALREHVYTAQYLGLFIIAFAFYALMHFVRHFLATKKHTPRWDKFLVAFSYVQVMIWLGYGFMPTALSYSTYLIVTSLCGIIVLGYMPVILATVLYYYFKKKTGPTGVVAIVPGLLWWGIGYTYLFVCKTLYDLYKTPYSKLYNWISTADNVATLVVFAWMIAIFSWALFQRYQDLQKSFVQASLDREIERSQLIEKQNAELEQLVAARTAELSTANRELSENQEEITAQRDQLSETVNELKTTQQQLIQSEKLASLGELTAGIAHEIQNPLNFVNNFSEVNTELIDEMQQEIDKGDLEEVKAIADNIKNNQQKISHHGKRADAIVKNMLQHSRNNSAEKQLTDVNALADEYLRLSYHGLRAKDKSFNANMLTHFDAALPKVDVIAQDIGRVLLNLYNNAFYAVQQKQKILGTDYKPEVKVATSFTNKTVQIIVRDNGIGIPEAIKEKILQPFFTTKPTGEGTGLGLSLSYDIVVKGHGGKIEIFSQEGEYTEFAITLFV